MATDTTPNLPISSAEEALYLWKRHKRALVGYWPYPKTEMDDAISQVASKVQAEFGFTPQMPKDAGLLGILLERHFGWPSPGELYQQAFGFIPTTPPGRDDASPAAAEYSLRFSRFLASLSGAPAEVMDEPEPAKAEIPVSPLGPMATNQNLELF